MMLRKLHRNLFIIAAFAAATALVAGGSFVAGQAPAAASQPELFADSRQLPQVQDLVSTSELEKFGASQDDSEIAAVIQSASADQHVQVLVDSNTGEYRAAVLVENAPDFTVYDQLADGDSSNKMDGVQRMAGIYQCPTSGVVKGISRHYGPARILGWCGSGTWSAISLSNWYQYSSNIGTASLVGPNVWTWITCPGYATCNISPISTLGFIEFN